MDGKISLIRGQNVLEDKFEFASTGGCSRLSRMIAQRIAHYAATPNPSEVSNEHLEDCKSGFH